MEHVSCSQLVQGMDVVSTKHVRTATTALEPLAADGLKDCQTGHLLHHPV